LSPSTLVPRSSPSGRHRVQLHSVNPVTFARIVSCEERDRGRAQSIPVTVITEPPPPSSSLPRSPLLPRAPRRAHDRYQPRHRRRAAREACRDKRGRKGVSSAFILRREITVRHITQASLSTARVARVRKVHECTTLKKKRITNERRASRGVLAPARRIMS